MIPAADRWGPFADGIEAAEQRARLRGLRALAPILCGPRAAIAALGALADGAQALLIGPKPEGAAVLQTGCESSDQDDGI